MLPFWVELHPFCKLGQTEGSVWNYNWGIISPSWVKQELESQEQVSKHEILCAWDIFCEEKENENERDSNQKSSRQETCWFLQYWLLYIIATEICRISQKSPGSSFLLGILESPSLCLTNSAWIISLQCSNNTRYSPQHSPAMGAESRSTSSRSRGSVLAGL